MSKGLFKPTRSIEMERSILRAEEEVLRERREEGRNEGRVCISEK